MDTEGEMKQGRLSIKSTCPFCGEIVDGYTSLDNDSQGPSDGDFTFCVYCLTPLRFIFGLRLRVMQNDELGELEPEQRKMFKKALKFFKGSPLFKGGKEVH
jgi:hypothetical protein